MRFLNVLLFALDYLQNFTWRYPLVGNFTDSPCFAPAPPALRSWRTPGTVRALPARRYGSTLEADMAALSEDFDGGREAPCAPRTTPLHDFAIRLVRQLGVEEAVHVCRANHWDGVLDEIRAAR